MRSDSTHFFHIGNDMLECTFYGTGGDEYRWYAEMDALLYDLYRIDRSKGFDSALECEEYMRKSIRTYCHKTLSILKIHKKEFGI